MKLYIVLVSKRKSDYDYIDEVFLNREDAQERVKKLYETHNPEDYYFHIEKGIIKDSLFSIKCHLNYMIERLANVKSKN